MSFNIKTTFDDNIEWHVGQEKPTLPKLDKIKLLQVDGDELIHIVANFNYLPIHKNQRVMIWKEPFAQFIFDNL